MEDEGSSVSPKSMNNGEPQDVGSTSINADRQSPQEDNLDANIKDETVKEEVTQNMTGEKNLEQFQQPDQDESSLGNIEDQVNKDNNEEISALSSGGDTSLTPKELNGELEVLQNSVNETLQIKVEPQESHQGNDEDSRCDIVRRSIRNRKFIDNRQSGNVKQTKPSKESAIKKPKKPVPMIGSNAEQNKRISSQVEGSRVGGMGGLRTRKKAQRKREKNSGGPLRGGVNNRGDPSPRPSAMAAPLTCAEYAQCLGLQPAVKFKCHKCGETNFASIGMLREHQAACPGLIGGVTSEEAAACATLAASGSNLHITQKLILCSACDTYFESWDLFLHMQSVHRRHICLFCLAMFSRAERLAGHLGSAHGASEASHPSADAFRSSRQSPCLLVCCTCERIFSDGDEFFDHSCRSGGFAGSSGDNIGSTSGGGSGEGKRESSSGGKCSDGANRGTDCSSGTTGVDNLRNSNPPQGTTDSDGDCTMNNAANLCQLHIRVAAKKALKRKDNVLVVIFERGEQNSDQMLMRVESKDTWETNNDDNNQLPDESGTSIDKNFSDESMSQEGDCKLSDTMHKDDIEKNLPQKSVVSEVIEPLEHRDESERKTPEIENGPKSDIDESSSDEIDKIESEEKGIKSPESIPETNTQSITSKQMDSDPQSEGEIVERDANIDHSLSEMSDDSRDEISEKPLTTIECGGDSEVCDDTAISKSRDSSIKFESDSQSYPENSNNNVNGEDNICESQKLPRDGNELSENPSKPDQINLDKTLQSDDEQVTAETNKNDEISSKQDNQTVNQQNGIDGSPSLADASSTMIDTLDDSGGVQLAGEEVPLTVLHLEKSLQDYSIQDLLKEAVKASCFSCVYCTHAKKIAVNGKQLAFHLLAEHRFQPIFKPIIKNEENDSEVLDDSDLEHICVEKLESNQPVSEYPLVKKDSFSDTPIDYKVISEFVDILKNSLEQLESSCFNCDSYDNSNMSALKVFSKSYECFQCRFATGLHKELYIHNRKMHQKTNLLCIMCKCTFYSYSELLCHLCPGMYVPNERPNFRCCFCSADSLPSAFRFMVHLRKRHHACDVCLEVTGDQQRLSGHVWKHKLNHLCYRCDIAYRNKPDITKHLFWKHGTESVLCKRCLQKKWPHVYHFCVPPAIFTCEECGSTFSRAVALRVHRRLHLGEAPHACPECGQHFISKRLVTRHQEIKHGDPLPKQTSDILSDSENIAVDSKIQPEEEGSLDQAGIKKSDIKKDLKNSQVNTHLQKHKFEEKVTSIGNINDGSYSSRNDGTSFCNRESNTVSVDKEAKDVNIKSRQQPQNSTEKEKPAKKVVDVMDLPPLNLSSESDDSDEETPPAKSQTMVDDNSEAKIHSDEEKQDQANCSPQQEEEPKPVEVVDGIWDNFKTYTATLEDPKSQLGETSSEVSKSALLTEDIGLMARIIKAEHDYCFPRESVEDSVEQSTEEIEPKVDETETKDKDQDDGFDHNYCSNNSKVEGGEIAHSSEVQEASPKKHPKSPKKRKKAGSGSSSSEASDSSDSDSSSCSCGTNCSCTSSSSSSASSSSGSDSDSSVTSGRGVARASRRERRKEGKRKRHLGSSVRPEDKVCSTGDGIRSPGSVKDGNARVDTVIAEDETPPLREVMIRESDLETEESETDEDFYDEQPRRFHGNSAAAMVLARLATGSSPSTVPLDDAALPSPATSVQSPASRPASPTTSLQWKPTPPTPSTPLPSLPPPVPIAEPEVKNSLENISEGCTPLIQPKKRGRKRKRPHLPTKFARKHADNEKCSSDQVPNLCLKVGKTVRRHKVVPPQQSYKLTPPVEVHSVQNSAGGILNSSVIHSVGEPTTPASISEGDDGIRLSKRKRVPKRFYGDSSDEEGESGGGSVVGGSGVSGVGGGGKLTIVLNQSGKVPKRKKSSIGPGSSVSFSREPASRASIDEVPQLQRPVYQSQDEVDDREINMSSDQEEDESQNGRSEGESDGWSGDEDRNEGASCMLPSTSPRTASQIPGESVGANTGSLYCYCQCPYDEVSEMIACDGKKCAIEWFHFECVGIMVPPKGKWYCPDCRKRCGSSGRTSDHLSGT